MSIFEKMIKKIYIKDCNGILVMVSRIYKVNKTGSCIVVGCTCTKNADLWKIDNRIIGLCDDHLANSSYEPVVNIFVYSFINNKFLSNFGIQPLESHSATLWKYTSEFTGKIPNYSCSVSRLVTTNNRRLYQNGIVYVLSFNDFKNLLNVCKCKYNCELEWVKPRLLSQRINTMACAFIPKNSDKFKYPNKEYLHTTISIINERRKLMGDTRKEIVKIKITNPTNGKISWYSH